MRLLSCVKESEPWSRESQDPSRRDGLGTKLREFKFNSLFDNAVYTVDFCRAILFATPKSPL